MRRWGPAGLPAVGALLLCLLLAAAALRPAASAPPAIAELSPDAVQQITEAPAEQAPTAAGPGAPTDGPTATTEPAVAATATTTTATTAPTVPPGARVRRCVPNGNGDGTSRQTEDPQSPPCVAFSEFDATTNGGATAQGVTADSVTVAVGTYTDPRLLAALETYFNDRFELHGRRLHLVVGAALDFGSSPTAAQITAEAVRADEELQAFAVTGLTVGSAGDDLYYGELARRGVVGVQLVGSQVTTDELLADAPYRWTLNPPRDVALAAKADWLCSSFAGRPAQFQGGLLGGAGSNPRRYGLVYSTRPDGSAPDLAPLLDPLAACGITPAVTVAVPWNASFSDFGYVSATDLSNRVVAQLRGAGVTTVISEATQVFEGALWSSASVGLFSPEWILSTMNLPASASIQNHTAKGELDRVFVAVAPNRMLPPSLAPQVAAVRSVDPSIAPGDIYPELYQALLVIASGIEHAGPDLTPQSFADALEGLRWSNAGTGAPLFQASVGFGPGDHSWFDDWTVAWFANGVNGPENGRPGAVCYLDGGRRMTVGGFPPDTSTLKQGCP